MRNDSPDGLWGKHEVGMTAVAICKACEAVKSWNLAFVVPGYDHDTHAEHVGLTWLIAAGALRAVPCWSSRWVVTRSFVERMAPRCEGLPDELPEDHGLVLPDLGYPREGRLVLR